MVIYDGTVIGYRMITFLMEKADHGGTAFCLWEMHTIS